jgi:glycosyltransferase involved in cell wall biosynthesis
VGDSAFGGGSRVILTLVSASLTAGASVTVIATDPTFCRHAREAGAEVIELDCIRRSTRLVWDLRGLLLLRRHFRASDYDLVHTHTTKAGFVGRLAAKLARVPAILHTAHGFSFHETTPLLQRMAYVLLEKCAGLCCDRIVAVSAFHRNWAVRLGIAPARKLIVIPNGIDRIEPMTAAERKALRAEFGVGVEQILVLSASRLARGKGLEHLLAAGQLLNQAGRADIRILVAGAGDQEDELHRRVRELSCERVVKLIGFRNDVPRLLGAADIVTLPSEREGLSIAVLEAFAAGRAVIASSIGSNLEAGEGVVDFVDYGDVGALAAAIADLSDDLRRRGEMGRLAFARFEERYTSSGMIDAYGKLYREMAAEA